jgi:outer membrane biosynthesis protein TonB
VRRVRPQVLVLTAAVLIVALLAYVFAGGSARRDRPSAKQVAARQPPADQPADTWASLPGDDEAAPAPAPPPPPPPEPEVAPRPIVQPRPVVRPAPPSPPKRTAGAQRETRTQANVRAEAPRKKTVAASTPNRPRLGSPPTRIAQVAPSAPATIARPSYNCRYARTRSEIAVCSDAALARLDRQMAAQFNNAMREGTRAQRDVLERSRLRFLYRRERCRTAACMAETYRARMAEINDIAARNWRDP